MRHTYRARALRCKSSACLLRFHAFELLCLPRDAAVHLERLMARPSTTFDKRQGSMIVSDANYALDNFPSWSCLLQNAAARRVSTGTSGQRKASRLRDGKRSRLAVCAFPVLCLLHARLYPRGYHASDVRKLGCQHFTPSPATGAIKWLQTGDTCSPT